MCSKKGCAIKIRRVKHPITSTASPSKRNNFSALAAVKITTEYLTIPARSHFDRLRAGVGMMNLPRGKTVTVGWVVSIMPAPGSSKYKRC